MHKQEISFGEWLRKQRRVLDLTRQAFAAQVGCAEVTLRRIEAGTLKPSKELANILLEKLGISETECSQWISFARGLSGFPSQSLPSSKPKSNLPASLTSFIGREKEQGNVIKLINKYRLVTLTGPGGVGKTRLSIKLGKQLVGSYPDGVWLVELAPILDALLVPRTTAIAIGLRDEPQRPVIDMLSDYLHEKSMLIILDNCEHILDACAQLADMLLKHCPGLKILATSREALGILGEAIYQVPSLELPDIRQLLEELRKYESVRLFEERAQLARMDFSLTIENASSVAKICTHLDGIPLGIELAAARVGTFSTEQIAERLQECFSLLTTGNRTALPRHQTLRAAIDWSYELLSPAEKAVFQRLSVFVNGWNLEAGEAICSDANIPSEEILDLLAKLANKSLVIMEEIQTGTRYHMLETIRQYAHEKLLEAGGSEAIRDKHLVYFVKFVEQAEPELYRSNQAFWFKKMYKELDNVRAAMEWASTTNSRLGLQLIMNWAGLSGWTSEERGEVLEVQRWLAQLLDQYHENDALRARALIVYGSVLRVTSNLAQAQTSAQQGLELARLISDKYAEAFSLLGLGVLIALQGDLKQGIPVLEESLALYESLGDKLGQATALYWLSIDHNAWERSKVYIVESLRLCRELGHLLGIADCLRELALRMIWEGDFSSCVPLLDEADMIFCQLGNKYGEADVLQNYGTLAYWKGDYQQAYAYHKESFELHETIGNDSLASWAGVNMAYALLRHGDISKAKEMFELWIQRYKSKDMDLVIYALEGLASLYVNQAQPERAAKLFAWTNVMRDNLGDRNPPLEQKSVERDLEIIRSHLDETAFENAYQTGRKMTLEQVIALGREM